MADLIVVVVVLVRRIMVDLVVVVVDLVIKVDFLVIIVDLVIVVDLVIMVDFLVIMVDLVIIVDSVSHVLLMPVKTRTCRIVTPKRIAPPEATPQLTKRCRLTAW